MREASEGLMETVRRKSPSPPWKRLTAKSVLQMSRPSQTMQPPSPTGDLDEVSMASSTSSSKWSRSDEASGKWTKSNWRQGNTKSDKFQALYMACDEETGSEMYVEPKHSSLVLKEDALRVRLGSNFLHFQLEDITLIRCSPSYDHGCIHASHERELLELRGQCYVSEAKRTASMHLGLIGVQNPDAWLEATQEMKLHK